MVPSAGFLALMTKFVEGVLTTSKTPRAVEPLISERVTIMRSAAVIPVWATVTVPSARVAVPIKSVAAPPSISA